MRLSGNSQKFTICNEKKILLIILEIMDNNVIKWLQDWYFENCNGDWEHTYGITIETLDNPGWQLKICLEDTKYENIGIDSYERQDQYNKDD